MCAESEGVVNTVLPDGKCTKCKNRVHNNFVTCLFCSCKFHATGCSNNDICTPMFLSSFKPFLEKKQLQNMLLDRETSILYVTHVLLTLKSKELHLKVIR